MANKNLNDVKINVNFTTASSRTNIKSGENISTTFGKLSKIISDMDGSAFTGDAKTVNGHTVQTDVPPNAVFGTLSMDTELSETSENAVQNKVITSALKGKLDLSIKGVNNGVAELDSNGKVPQSQLPSYVDDVIDGYLYNGSFYTTSSHTIKISAESGKIYIDIPSLKTYRWSGTAFVVISETIALGETSSTACRGDWGKTAYEHSQLTSGNPHNVTKSDIGLSNVENKSSTTIRGELTESDITSALGYTPSSDDTLNTAGSLNKPSTKLFLVGAINQSQSDTTYSNSLAYIGTNGHLYSNGIQTVNLSDTQNLTNKTYNGYTLGDACAKGVDTTAKSGSGNLITSGAMFTALSNKSDIDHNHVDISGNAVTSNKLNAKYVGSDASESNGYYKFASYDVPEAENHNITFLITNEFEANNVGILQVWTRREWGSTNVNIPTLRWLLRVGFASDCVIAVTSGSTVTLYINQTITRYGRIGVSTLSSSHREEVTTTTLYSSSSPTTGLSAAATSSDSTVPIANKIGTSTVGSSTKPVYLNGGVPTACQYTLGSICTKSDSDYATASHTHSGYLSTEGGRLTGNLSIGSDESLNDLTVYGDIITYASVKAYGLEVGGNKDVGSDTVPIYLSKGVFKTSKYTLADACSRGVKTATSSTHTNYGTNNTYVPDIAFLSNWDGSYNNSGSSNLSYCRLGSFGNACVLNTVDSVIEGNENLITSKAVYTALENRAPLDHDHDEISGNAGAANKLLKTFVGSDKSSSSGYYKFASYTITGGYNNYNLTFLLTNEYNGDYAGILQVWTRSDSSSSTNAPTIKWLIRTGFASDCVIATKSGLTVTLYVKLTTSQYGRIGITMLSASLREKDAVPTLYSSSSPTTGLTASATSSDSTVPIANKIGTSTIGSSTKPVYLNGGVPTACSYTLGSICTKSDSDYATASHSHTSEVSLYENSAGSTSVSVNTSGYLYVKVWVGIGSSTNVACGDVYSNNNSIFLPYIWGGSGTMNIYKVSVSKTDSSVSIDSTYGIVIKNNTITEGTASTFRIKKIVGVKGSVS